MSSHCSTREHSAYATGKITYEDDRLFRPGGLTLTARAIELAHLAAGATVLDVGCGAGQSVRYMRTLGINSIGVDCASSGDHVSGEDFASHTTIEASAEDLPFPDHTVDAVLVECSLSVVEKQDRAVSEFARVLVDGGRLMISDLYARQPNGIAQVRKLKNSCVAGTIVRDELEASLVACGFEVNAWEDHSKALRECAARFILERGSLQGMWNCDGEASAETIQAAMKLARVGYFLMVATRNRREPEERRLQR
jgi:SAM-dependent methyltransferase